MKPVVTLSALACVMGVSAAWAEPIKSIVVQGNERVENTTVETYLPFKIGDDFDAGRVGDVIKTLYATGLFHEVDVRWDGAEVSIDVLENPLVSQVTVEGNETIAVERLKEGLVLKPRALFTAAKARQDAQYLEDVYRSRGRFLTKVTPQMIARDQNRVDVVYKVEEGAEAKIADVKFIGNRHFSDGELREVIATKRKAWWRVFSSNDTFDQNRMNVDKELLRREYLNSGFADFQVQSAVAELSRDKNKFYITYTITEGPRYDFGRIGVQLNADEENLDVPELEKELSLKTGELYNAERVEENVSVLVDALGDRGFAFLDVQPEFERNEIERTVDVTYAINPGPRVYVNRINVEGNDRTRDYVVRREMRLAEGDAYSSTKLQRSRDRVNRLGYFKNVNIKTEEADDPDRVDVTVEVEEQSTGEFSIGAGFSSYEGLLATADVKERNFLGKGQEVAVRFAVSEVQQSFNVGFTEPYFMGQDLAAGVDAFNEQIDVQDESSFDQDNTGAALRFRFPLGEFTSNAVKLGFKETKISNVGSNASTLVAREAGKRSSAFLANTWALDTRDSYLTPTRGHRLSVTGEYSGFGSDVDYIRGLVQGTWHTEVMDDVVLSVGARAGAITDLGQDLPIYEHFNAGGTTLRGFAQAGIGPRDRITSDALGGKYMVGNNVELTFPLGGFFKELGVKGLLFSDGGLVSEFDDATSVVEDSKIYRVTAGTGIHWQSPVGPLRLEFGIPLIKAEEDQTQVFSFSVGSRF